jgi:AraC-like DNA-binding protein
MFTDQVSQAVAAAYSIPMLDNTAKLVWRGLAEGVIDDAAAERLSADVEARRDALRSKPRQIVPQQLQAHPRPCRSPDRARSIRRRRGLAASGAVPGTIAAHFTTGEIAALTVIARQCQRSRSCDWFMDRIAAVAGVSRTTVRNALRQAQALGLISVQERRLTAWRSDSNIIRVVSAEWLAWLGLGGGRKKERTTNNQFYNQKETTGNVGDNGQLFRVCSGHGMAAMIDSGHGKPRHNYRTTLNR